MPIEHAVTRHTHTKSYSVKREIEAMEIGEEGAKIMAKKNPKLAIEDYLDFIDNRTLHLTASQLRQIIGMHGFKRMKARKRVLIDMVTTMDLMDLHRSTLLDGGISRDACLTLKEVINDLKDLDWQECHVTSLHTQGAAVSASSASSDGTVSAKRKKSNWSRRKKVEVAVDHSVISTTGTTVAARSTTGRSVKKLKGSRRKKVEVAVDHSVISTTGTTVAARSTTERSVDCNSSELIIPRVLELESWLGNLA